jgi:hypothetical protein
MEEMPTKNQDSVVHDLCAEYVECMNEKERKAYMIAKTHLGDSFQLEKSIGFLDWVKSLHEQKTTE